MSDQARESAASSADAATAQAGDDAIRDDVIRPEPDAAECRCREAEAEVAQAEVAAAQLSAALERERWLRTQFEREHQVTMSVMRILLGSVGDQSRRMRFWRWLIDDQRSERRRQEALLRTDEKVDAAFGRRRWTW